jgi:hypothetical protein
MAGGMSNAMKMKIRLLLTSAAALAVFALTLVAGGTDSVYATSFNPTLTASVADPTPGVPSDVVSHFDLPDGDVNFAAVVSFIPPEWGVVPGADIPIGMQTGILKAQSVLGLINGPCNQQLPVTFDMLNASINMNETVSFNDEDNNNTADFADEDGNGLAKAVSLYPDFLKRVFEDENGDAMQPLRRSAGITLVAGTPVLLEFLIFPPGTQIPTRGQGTLPSDEALGYPSVTVLQNIGDTDATPEPSIINDFCTPLATINTSYGQEKDEDGNVVPNGQQFFVNPSGEAKYTYTTFAFGQRDADGDTYENSLDTCPVTANVGNPRISNDGDADGDGLDEACDPNSSATTGTNSDQDADGYQNRNDNCPLKANGQAEGEENQKDTDLDQIGDICDTNPTTPDGDLSQAEPTADVTIGSGSGSPAAPTSAQCPKCYVKGQPVVTNPPSGGGTGTPASGTPGGGTPGPTATPGGGNEGGGGSGTTIAIIAGVIAAIVVIGGGAALVMRRRGS